MTVYQGEWMTALPTEAIRTDPTRMAQRIMTGIGFLGAPLVIELQKAITATRDEVRWADLLPMAFVAVRLKEP